LSAFTLACTVDAALLNQLREPAAQGAVWDSTDPSFDFPQGLPTAVLRFQVLDELAFIGHGNDS
jgi:hypothetical protein